MRGVSSCGTRQQLWYSTDTNTHLDIFFRMWQQDAVNVLDHCPQPCVTLALDAAKHKHNPCMVSRAGAKFNLRPFKWHTHAAAYCGLLHTTAAWMHDPALPHTSLMRMSMQPSGSMWFWPVAVHRKVPGGAGYPDLHAIQLLGCQHLASQPGPAHVSMSGHKLCAASSLDAESALDTAMHACMA